MIKYNNTLITSLSESVYDCVNKLLEEYQSLNPSFKYNLSFATNYDTNCEPDVFDVVLQLGTIERVPAHFVKVGEKEEMIFAGITDIVLSVLNPVSMKYTENLPFTQLQSKTLSEDYSNQTFANVGQSEDFPIVDDETLNKIEDTVRLLEGLSTFMYRKSLIVNDYEFTIMTDLPQVTGEFDYGVYRITEEIYAGVKFQKVGDFQITSGENVKLMFDFGTEENPQWEEFYALNDFLFAYGMTDNKYPVSPKALVQNANNQMQIQITISAPAFTKIGANKRLLEWLETGQLQKTNFIRMKYSEDNGLTWKKTRVNINSLDYPRNINAFGTHIYTLFVLDPIEKVGD